MDKQSLKDTVLRSAAAGINVMLSPLGIEIKRKLPNQACTYLWLEEAKHLGMDINDYIEKDQSKPALTELESWVFPLISADAIVCELGPGTGCYTRRIIPKISAGEVHVVDNDEFCLDFLQKYLSPNPRVHFHLNSGSALPFTADSWMDLFFCASMFTGNNLTIFFSYIREAYRVLKNGGYCVFDYFDASVDSGWQVLIKNMARQHPILAYNFHSAATIDRILSHVGFETLGRHTTLQGSTFVISRKAV